MQRKKHMVLEGALRDAFPAKLIGPMVGTSNTRLERAVHALFSGRQWPDGVGYRMLFGELDPSLSTWIEFLPADTMAAVLPSHLLLASLLLPQQAQENYLDDVCEALMLPPADAAEMAALDAAICTSAPSAQYGAGRRRLYQALSVEQRTVVALFLDLYWAYCASQFASDAEAPFLRNLDSWRNSSLPTT
jgi:hypothetical protein